MDDLRQLEVHPDADQLSAFLEDALPDEARQQTLAHLALCADCRAVVALVLPQLRDAVPAAQQPLRAGLPSRWANWFGASSMGRRLATSAAAFALLAFATVAIYKEDHRRPPVSGQANLAAVPPPVAPAVNVPAAAPAGPSPNASQAQFSNAQTRSAQAGLLTQKVSKPSAGEGHETAAAAPASSTGATAALQSASRAPAASAAAVVMGAASGMGVAPSATLRVMVVPQPLPSHLAVLSQVEQGGRIVAIDANNEVFASQDRGHSWTAVRAPWPGRALRVDRVVQATPPTARARQSFAASPPPSMPKSQSLSVAPAPAAPPATDAAEKAVTASAARSSLRGQVADATGAAIPQATVTLNGGIGTAPRTARTDAAGHFELDGVAPGGYLLQAAAAGFAQASAPVEIKPGADSSAALRLPVAAASEAVTVNAASDEVDAAPIQMQSDGELLQLATPRRPAFTVTTDRGEHWVSADGVHWSRE